MTDQNVFVLTCRDIFDGKECSSGYVRERVEYNIYKHLYKGCRGSIIIICCENHTNDIIELPGAILLTMFNDLINEKAGENTMPLSKTDSGCDDCGRAEKAEAQAERYKNLYHRATNIMSKLEYDMAPEQTLTGSCPALFFGSAFCSDKMIHVKQACTDYTKRGVCWRKVLEHFERGE